MQETNARAISICDVVPVRFHAAWRSDIANSPVTFPEHDIHGAEHRRRIREHVALHHEVHRLQMAERGRADLAAVGFVGAVGDEVDAEFALGAFGRDIDFAGRDDDSRAGLC